MATVSVLATHVSVSVLVSEVPASTPTLVGNHIGDNLHTRGWGDVKMKDQPHRDLNPVPLSQWKNHATNWANKAGLQCVFSYGYWPSRQNDGGPYHAQLHLAVRKKHPLLLWQPNIEWTAYIFMSNFLFYHTLSQHDTQVQWSDECPRCENQHQTAV